MSTAARVVSTALPPFRNEPLTDFSRREEREAFQRAMADIRARLPLEAPLLIGGKRIETEETIPSVSPSDTSLLCGRSSAADQAAADKAVATARRAFEDWSHTTAEDRAALLLRTADLMRQRRHLFSALEVYEAAKPWHEADADVAEAIDFLEYYAREAIRLSGRKRLQPYILGEYNDLSYHPLGVVAVIGPWNFPLAIPVGMSSAALVTGNTVILKPAEQTPLVAWLYARLLEEAGAPPGVFNFLPGRGEVCGAHLVRHPDVRMIVFTGSRDVGLLIQREAVAAQQEGLPFVKKIVTEMGGKNALIVDSSADLDASVPDAVYSAYGFAGQKCSALSRLILLDDVYDVYLRRFREAVESLKTGPAGDPGTQVPPVIDAEAAEKVHSYIRMGEESARPVYRADVTALAGKGHFVPPAIFEVASSTHRLAQEEIFGPVVAVLRAGDFDEALRIANSTPYALTGGVHSRTVSHLERARQDFQCGNLYLNRTITGAIVARQPFGGYRLSGIGAKAGGPDYLKQFMIARAVSENRMRHGSAPLTERGTDDTWEEF